LKYEIEQILIQAYLQYLYDKTRQDRLYWLMGSLSA